MSCTLMRGASEARTSCRVSGTTHNLLKLWRHWVCRGHQQGDGHLFPAAFLCDSAIECKQ